MDVPVSEEMESACLAYVCSEDQNIARLRSERWQSLNSTYTNAIILTGGNTVFPAQPLQLVQQVCAAENGLVVGLPALPVTICNEQVLQIYAIQRR